MKVLLVCFLVAGAVMAENVLDINDGMDKLFGALNKISTPVSDLGKGEVEVGGFKVSQSYLIGLNTIKRTGNCTMTSKEDLSEATIDLHYGLDFGHLVFGKVEVEGIPPFTGIVRIKDNSIHASWTRFNTAETGCKVRINNFEYESLKDVQASSNYPEVDGQDISYFFTYQVLPLLNDKLTELKPVMEEVLARNVCAPHQEFFSPQNTQFLTQFLTSLFNF